MRLVVLFLTLVLTACVERQLDVKERGDPTRLLYAEQGTRITLRSTADGEPTETVVTAARPKGPQGRLIRADGTEVSFYPGCWNCGDPNTINEVIYGKLWPLEVGRQVEFPRTSPGGEVANVTIRVAGIEDVTTPAGTFQTWLLDGRVENLTGARYSAQVRAWWAPGPGWVVKAEGGDSQGATVSSEVIAFARP